MNIFIFIPQLEKNNYLFVLEDGLILRFSLFPYSLPKSLFDVPMIQEYYFAFLRTFQESAKCMHQ